MKTNLTPEDIIKIIELYQTEIPSTHKLAEKFKVGHKKISQILSENDIIINKKGGQTQIGNSSEIESSKTNLYINSDTHELIAQCKKTNVVIKDPNNLSGKLTKHIIDLYDDVWIPTNTYQRKKYELINKKKWFEEYFNIVEIEILPTRKCKVCEWETTDTSNKTGCFENHINQSHGIILDDYLSTFPNDIIYHPNYVKKTELNKFLSKTKNYVICKICGEKMKSISNTHLKNKHNITTLEYKLKYPNEKIVSTSVSEGLSDLAKLTNVNMVPTWTSKGETEVKEFIESLGFNVSKGKNRKLLDGKEIDLIIDETNICIEYDGLYYHTEKMGKTSTYHLNKTIECNQIGYKLIHIFEDEWKTKEELVKTKIKHLLKVNDGIRIGGRSIVIKKINSEDKTFFLNQNHIQGNDKSNIFYGGYYNNELVGVMTFNNKRNMTKNNDGEYELSRFATKQNYVIIGLASKVLKQFVKDYKPKTIISFADRRWTIDSNNNLYTNLGFSLVSITKPTYYYYNSKINRYKRFHKFGFGKNNLKKRFPDLDYNKTEKELTSELGYDKIWDCGLFKYELKVL
jgi:DNA-binding transcriptional regulator YhcF (GntR family)/very-short-patch-repair endonuclease